MKCCNHTKIFLYLTKYLEKSFINVKAKELGIPIISEDEFITLFGDPGEFDFEPSDFWESFASELECYEDFAVSIKVIYAYSKWMKKANLDRAFRSIIQIALLYDEDLQEELVDLVKQLESGKYVDEIEEITAQDHLPDGYMEAFEMIAMAEEFGGSTPSSGQIISSKGTFDLVIAQAEAGDAKAKLTAGKYFIADHIEYEFERAIQWIQDAAAEGIQEAIDYINSNKTLFE